MLKNFSPAQHRSENQDRYIHAIRKNDIIFCTGHAGTGKTFLALSEAIRCIHRESKVYDRIIVIRPYIPSNMGEKIGALPGTLDEKVAPYVEGIKDNLKKLKINQNEIDSFIRNKMEFAVLSMCRGRSFSNCIVIVEEAQNVPKKGDAMKMLLTRVGENCKMIICGDTDQIDLPGGASSSALEETIKMLNGVRRLRSVDMRSEEDIQRSPMIGEILNRFKEFEEYGT